MNKHVQNIDRRRDPRVDVAETAVVLARFNSGTDFTIENISVGGARIVGPITLDQGERIQILFEMDGLPVELKAEVVSIVTRTFESDRVLVRFVEVEPTMRDSIRAMVQRRLDRELERPAADDGS